MVKLPFTHRDKNGSTTHKLNSYSPHTALTPPDFTIDPQLLDYQRTLSRHTFPFLKKARPDKHNGAYFDQQIAARQQATLADIGRQHVEHLTLNDYKDCVRNGDLLKCEEKLRFCDQQIERLEQSIAEGEARLAARRGRAAKGGVRE